jgi:hypothetical protein
LVVKDNLRKDKRIMDVQTIHIFMSFSQADPVMAERLTFLMVKDCTISDLDCERN